MRRYAWQFALLMLLAWVAIPALAESQARIVRLSYVDGDVQIDRAAGQGFERAISNMPITQGMKLRTAADGQAEVEFENGSTVRLIPSSEITFDRLSIGDEGAKFTTVFVENGLTYFNVQHEKRDKFAVRIGAGAAEITRDSRFRVAIENGNVKVAMFKGEVEIATARGIVSIKKNETLTMFVDDSDRYTLAKGIDPDEYDKWDLEREDYHREYLAKNSYKSSYRYGVADLGYYGNWVNVAGYGSVWRPFIATSAWNPYMSGAWVYYPGAGYTWVSSYPWGWAPYRFGSWAFVGSYGWVWVPGGGVGWYPTPRVVNPPSNWTPPTPPTTGGRPTVIVNNPRDPALPNRPRRVDDPSYSGRPGGPRRPSWDRDSGRPGGRHGDAAQGGVPQQNPTGTPQPNAIKQSDGSTPVMTRPEHRPRREAQSDVMMDRGAGSPRPAPRMDTPRPSAPPPRVESAPRVETPRPSAPPPRMEAPRQSGPSPRMEAPPARVETPRMSPPPSAPPPASRGEMQRPNGPSSQ